MTGKENIPLLTRAAAKRAAMAAAVEHRHLSKRKRVPLGELPLLGNANSSVPVAREPKKPPAAAAGYEEAEEFDFENAHQCARYTPDMYNYLRSMEEKGRPCTDFLDPVKTEVMANMRAILVSWLVEVTEEFKLVADTLYLTISYVDRFLSKEAVKKQSLQLLGISSMLIASKYEEITPPHVEDFCYITDNTYNEKEVVRMEARILKLLEFELGNPTIKTFLRRFVRIAQLECDDSGMQLELLSNYIAELSLIDYECLKFLPSSVAASAVFLAKVTIDSSRNPWSKLLESSSGYRAYQLRECVLSLQDMQLNKKGSTLSAIRDKYNTSRYRFVAALIPPSPIPGTYFEDHY